MKLRQEYEGIRAKVENLDRVTVLAYKESLLKSGEYRSFETRFVWGILHAVVLPAVVCSWYEKYECNDSHITTLMIKICKDLKFIG